MRRGHAHSLPTLAANPCSQPEITQDGSADAVSGRTICALLLLETLADREAVQLPGADGDNAVQRALRAHTCHSRRPGAARHMARRALLRASVAAGAGADRRSATVRRRLITGSVCGVYDRKRYLLPQSLPVPYLLGGLAALSA